MTNINNNLLRELAKALNSESYAVPQWVGFSDQSYSPTVTDTVLTGEYGDRVPTVNTRTSRTVSFSFIRATDDMTDQINGDLIESLALFDSETTGMLLTTLPIVATTQTTNFDILGEVQYEIVR